MLGRRRLACSFCGRDRDQVAKLVAGPKVYICDRCVEVAGRIMEQADAEPRGSGLESTLFSRFKT